MGSIVCLFLELVKAGEFASSLKDGEKHGARELAGVRVLQ
jgi:hypothetical protein